MRVKTGALRDNLSKYLNRVRQSGNPIVVLDRNVPVAEIRPYPEPLNADLADTWKRRAHFEKEFGEWDEDLALPERTTSIEKQKNPLD